MLADMDTSAFKALNGVVSQPPGNVDAPIGWCCTGPPVPECVYGCVCVWMRVTVCMCKCALCTGVSVSVSVSVYRV